MRRKFYYMHIVSLATVAALAGCGSMVVPIDQQMLTRIAQKTEAQVGGYDYQCLPIVGAVREVRCDGQPGGSYPVVWQVANDGHSALLTAP